jgi:hypothetical protein
LIFIDAANRFDVIRLAGDFNLFVEGMPGFRESQRRDKPRQGRGNVIVLRGDAGTAPERLGSRPRLRRSRERRLTSTQRFGLSASATSSC